MPTPFSSPDSGSHSPIRVGAALSSSALVQFLRFLVVGGVGFVVDGGLLLAFVSQNTDPHLARAISFPFAVTATWLLNRIWTFSASRRRDAKRQFGGYVTVQLCGAACNFLCYAIVLSIIGVSTAATLAAFSVGSAFGLLINFAGARRFVFAD